MRKLNKHCVASVILDCNPLTVVHSKSSNLQIKLTVQINDMKKAIFFVDLYNDPN